MIYKLIFWGRGIFFMYHIFEILLIFQVGGFGNPFLKPTRASLKPTSGEEIFSVSPLLWF